MKQLINTLKRAWYLVMIRSLERELHDQREALQMVRRVSDLRRIMISEGETREELAHYRAEYVALLPVGERRTWRTA